MERGCIIQIRIGDQLITLDPNSNISADDTTRLVDAVDISKLRLLYSNLKDKINLDKSLESVDQGQIENGRIVYEGIVEESTKKLNSITSNEAFRDAFISPIAALTKVTNESDKKALSAYINSLDSTEVLASGNFLEDMRDAYKLSPYTKADIRSLVFKGNSAQLELFDQLTSIPGMETLRMSIAITSNLTESRTIDDVTGVYMTPDNIIQILVPLKYYEKPASTSPNADNDAANLTKQGYNKVKDVILHELTHAVFSELYQTAPEFRTAIKRLKDVFVKESKQLNEARRNALVDTYYDRDNERRDELKTHEFLADIFTSPKLRAALNSTVSKDKLYQSAGENSLYSIFMSSLSRKYQINNSLLRDVIATISNNVPTGTLMDSFQGQEVDFMEHTNKSNLFFFTDANIKDVIAHTGFRDQTDTPWDINSKAFWMQEQLKLRLASNNFMKEAYYEGSIRNPTDYEIDLLYSQDLAIVPWVRYQKSEVEGEWGEWIEVGAIVDGNGRPILKDGQEQLIDVTRDKDGEIIQNSELGTIQARERSMPVLYSNSKSKRVTLAKTGLKTRTDQKYNTLSLPYEMIRGIRKYDRSFFDHNKDYDIDINRAEAELKQSKLESGDAKYDNTAYWQKQLDLANSNKADATLDKATMIKDYQDYAYTFTDESGETKMNLTREDYAGASFMETSKLNKRLFARPEEAVYTIATYKKSGKSLSIPNPKLFQLIWDEDMAAEFARLSKDLSQTVSRGDMIRMPSEYEKVIDGKKTKVPGFEWRHVHKKLANGVMISTKDGVGFIVPYNKITGYAKNKSSIEWEVMNDKLNKVLTEFESKIYMPKAEKAKSSTLSTEFSKYKALQFNTDYHLDEDEGEEASRVKFKDRLETTKKYIEPLKTFVKTRRTYQSGKEVKDSERIELVVAKTDEGLLVMREYEGNNTFDFIRYDDKLDADKAWGKELLFVVEDYSKVKELYQDSVDEKDQFEANKDKDSYISEGTKENPVWKPAFDFKANPRGYRDLYDIYEQADAVKISRLVEGDIVAIKIKDPKPGQKDYYFRKVVTVKSNGYVVVADNRPKDVAWGKAGVYPRYVKPADIVKVGYQLGEITGDKDNGFHTEVHQDIIDRRIKMMEYAQRDLDYNDFYFTTAQTANKFNSNSKFTEGWNDRYVPLTNKILNPKSTDEEVVFLDKNLRPVVEANAAWIKAKFDGDKFGFPLRGINANTDYWKAENITAFRGKKLVVHPDILDKVMPGDWVITEYRKKGSNERGQWASLIDRVENGVIYKINYDNSTSPLTMSKFVALRTSIRNDKFSDFKRRDEIKAIVKDIKNSKTKPGKQSLELSFKSPADSQRALYEIGDRMKKLNPDIHINFATVDDITKVYKLTGHSYDSARAFILNGEVYINLDKASVSDVVHEYAHLFLHNLKYENPALYERFISMAAMHPYYDRVAGAYPHLNEEDLNEEVFVTLLGEHMKGKMENNQYSWFNTEESKDNILNFANYTKSTLNNVMGAGALYNIPAEEILNMQLEQVMSLVGDEIMQSRISSMSDNPMLQSTFDVERLRKDLYERGLLTQECYG